MKLAKPRFRLRRGVGHGLLALLLICLTAATGWAAEAPPVLEPGLYQTADGQAALRLQPLAEGVWEMLLWQGPAESEPGAGFAFLGRLLSRPGTARLSGTWQSLPGSCCPGRGRGEIEALDARSLRFVSFAPSLDQSPWPALPQAVFTKVAELPPLRPLARLVGAWRVAMWYSDLLPGGAPADLVKGRLRLTAAQGRAEGVWEGRPGELYLTPGPEGLTLEYKDPAAGYELSASLSEEAGGLALGGPFRSTLGQGRLRLVRAGLPAEPPCPGTGAGGGLSGVWVDPRTGNDFFRIKSSAQGFDFTAYGGSLAQPRYLSKGSARQAGPGRFEGRAKDVEGYCCGNQGRLVFRQLSPDRLEVSSVWWPAGQPDPGTPPGEPYVIERSQREAALAGAPPTPAGRWPLVQAARPGLLAPAGGAVRVAFTWQPGEHDQPGSIYTLFSQGGYLRDMDLFIDAQGRLAARIRTRAGLVAPAAAQPLTPGAPHEAWLVYQAGGQARLVLDGRAVAEAEMGGPWVGSNSPYLVGASRWPGRAFQGDIERVELYAQPQDPAQPGEPALVITPPPAPAEPQGQGQAPEAPKARPLVRWWSPERLVHAYAVQPAEAARLQSAGFVRQGPVAGLWDQPLAGAEPLYGFRHRGQGYTLLSTSQAAPAGCDSLGLMGYILPQPAEGSVALHELRASFPEPLRGGSSADVLYTSSPQALAAAREAGYGQDRVVGYVQAVKEPDFTPPLLYDWAGVWRGEGWGRFFLSRRGQDLMMYWYYGRADGPHYYGHYRLSPDLKRAEGIAVGRPGKGASYYRHRLEFLLDSRQGPRIRLTSWRLAAPLDDGRLVRFAQPKPTTTLLSKQAQALPPAEAKQVLRALGPPDPAARLQKALADAQRQGRLLER